MTDNISDLHVEMVGDIQICLTVVLQKQFPGTDVIQTPPKQSGAWVCLPIRINLLQYPGNKLLSSVEKKIQSFFFSPHEVQTIETYITDNHLSKEAAFIELIKLSLQDHKYLRKITRIMQSRRKSAKDIQVKVDIELLGLMEWNEKHADDTTA